MHDLFDRDRIDTGEGFVEQDVLRIRCKRTSDLTASALSQSPDLATFAGRVSDSGEGRWTIEAAIEEGVPADVLAAALFARFTSRGEADFQNRVLSAMRFAFGGHVEQHA